MGRRRFELHGADPSYIKPPVLQTGEGKATQLSDVWRTVQGSNLRHLSVLRDSSPLPCLSANRPTCLWRKVIESNDQPYGWAGFRDRLHTIAPDLPNSDCDVANAILR